MSSSRVAATVLLIAAGFSAPLAGSKGQQKITISRFTYHGWPGSLLISNGTAETVVVPAVGRIMQFHFVAEPEVFWENPALYGKRPQPNAREWANFGGDKTWPAPQNDWPHLIGRGWPPPFTFDSVPLEAKAIGDIVELKSPIDPIYGIRFRRRIELDRRRPLMTITTEYEKASGNPVRVGIGVITQLGDPDTVFMILPKKSRFPQGYVQQQFGLPRDLRVHGRFVSLRRGKQAQIGCDADTLVWMDHRYVLKMDSPRIADAQYADQNTNATIYTSADPLKYVELEPFGPLRVMKVGDHMQQVVRYTLLRRTKNDPLRQAELAVP
ncbi:MAG: hypothetical protein JO266_11865 [Acidobacteria bacterium]|nr:hypothetical protein [Acidobacteriota bacterium]